MWTEVGPLCSYLMDLLPGMIPCPYRDMYHPPYLSVEVRADSLCLTWDCDKVARAEPIVELYSHIVALQEQL